MTNKATLPFTGFERPESNYFRVPNSFWMIDDLTVHERMVLLYILRHTWGYHEYTTPKNITVDEFMNGRKSTKPKYEANDGRIDNGVGISRGAVSNALNTLQGKGYISVDVDDSDKARVKKSYMLCMRADEVRSQDESGVHEVNSGFTERTQRSSDDPRTEKETKKETKKDISDDEPAPTHETEVDRMIQAIADSSLPIYGDTRQKVARLLLKQYNDTYNVDRPFTPADVPAFVKWWDKTKVKKDGTKLSYPTNLGSCQKWFQIWRDETGGKKVVIEFRVDDTDDEPVQKLFRMAQ